MEDLISNFYTAFSKGDFKTMKSCYHDKAEFYDPAFGALKGAEVGAMWHMLLSRASDLEITFSNIFSDGTAGSADWSATYTFSKTGRKVTNEIHAIFMFEDGKIIFHKDSFDFYRWSKQAFGPLGWILGWTGFFQKKVNAQVRGQLTKFMTKNGYL